jgi:hypothetical protein
MAGLRTKKYQLWDHVNSQKKGPILQFSLRET